MENNILILGFNGNLNSVVSKLLIEYKFTNCYLISTDKPEGLLNTNYYNWNDIKYSGYYKDLEWDRISPLSSEILDKSKNIESQFYSMYIRIDPKISYLKLNQIYKSHLRFWNDFILKKKINLFLSSNIPHEGFDYIIYGLLKIYAVKTIMMYSLPVIPYKVVTINYIFDLDYPLICLEKEYQSFKLESKIVELTDLREDFRNYFVILSNEELNSFTRADLTNSFIIKKIFQLFVSPITIIKGLQTLKKHYNVNIFILFLRVFRDFVAMSLIDIHNLRLNKYYKKLCSSPDYSKNYLYFPLNYQPEASTNPLAGNYYDLSLIAEEVSFLLPKDYFLYIKEHPRLSPIRTKDFYKKLSKIKNIRFIDSIISPIKLVKNSKAVITTTGSVGIESIINLKPVMMFGSRVYQYSEGIHKIDNRDDIVSFIGDLENGDIRVDLSLVIKFFKLLENYSIQGTNYLPDLKKIGMTNEENSQALFKLIEKSFISDC